MGAWDTATELGETAWNTATPFSDSIKSVPVLGDLLNGVQGGYHLGAAAYDGMTGDRDGALQHGVQGAFSLAAMMPGMKALGTADKFIAPVGGAARLAGTATGNAVLKDAPQSVGDLAAAQTVTTANAVFGKDDSNWIADGDRAQGTRRGEIGAGLSTALALTIPGGIGLAPTINQYLGGTLGDAAGSLFNVKPDAPTTGAEGTGTFQKLGTGIHDLFGGLF